MYKKFFSSLNFRHREWNPAVWPFPQNLRIFGLTLGGVGSFGYAAHEIERIPMMFLEISQDSLQAKMVGSSYLLMMRPFF